MFYVRTPLNQAPKTGRQPITARHPARTKTRSGKIMHRLLREPATHGEIKGETTTLENFTVIAKLREAEEG